MVDENKPQNEAPSSELSEGPGAHKEKVEPMTKEENATTSVPEESVERDETEQSATENQDAVNAETENVGSLGPSSSPKKPESPQDEEDADDTNALLGLDDLNLSSVDVYELSNYTFGRKDRESRSFGLRAKSREEEKKHFTERYAELGLRRSVAAVLLVHEHRFAHVLLLQRADGTGDFFLPGGRLRPGESDFEGLTRKLQAKLTPDGTPKAEGLEVGELLSNWYRIECGGRFYPYLPAHVTAPKEELHVYEVPLPESFAFSVPRNMQLVAIPVYDLFNDPDTYGNVIAAVPSLISRIHKNYC